MNNLTLSICIPTYNRANYLRQCLDSIVSQFEDKEIMEQMEVVISDNASSDNTTEVVKEYQDKFPNIKYFRNEKNLGVDRNILNIVEKSSAEYCLIIGDDDAFFPNTFPLFLNKIKTINVPYYLLNGWGYDHELIHPVLSHPNREEKVDVLYDSLAGYIGTIKKYTNLIGEFNGLSQIFSRKKWMDLENKEQYIGTNTIHFLILLSIFKNDKFVFLAEPTIKMRSSNIRWDVFPGLGTIKGRITSTVDRVIWVRNEFNLPISDSRIKIYFYTREYWFTFKEIVKRILSRIGLEKSIILYRKVRNILH